MQTDTLAELTQQSSSHLERLKEGDASAIDKLQATLDQIGATIDALGDAPTPWRDQTKDSTAAAVVALQQVMSPEVDAASREVQTLTAALAALTLLIEQSVEQPVEPAEPTVAGVETANAASEAKEADFTILADDLELITDFIGESTEHLEDVEAGMLELEGKPGDTEVLNKVFRAFHTVKGMAGFLNLAQIGSLAHSAENLLDLARRGDLTLAGDRCDLIFQSVDMLKTLIAALKASAASGRPVARIEGLEPLLERLKGAENPNPKTQESADPIVNPPDEAPRSDADEVMQSEVVQEADRKLDTLLTGTRPSEAAPEPDRSPVAKATLSDEKIKVSTSRLDNLINMTGELVIAQLMVTEEIDGDNETDPELGRKVGYQSKLVRELQELSMSMRMVPVQGVFQKMARLVRDLARKADKQIEFTTVGEETELDRSIVDKIADPLVHMVRNSADHGVETPAERKQAGKPATGSIELRAFHQAGNIVIEIEDDGRGLDREKLLQKALSQGLVQPDQKLTDEEVFKLIFHAGFSTAAKVTSVSGRGVGMDVVRRNIEELRGKIEISSTLGRGTKFAIRMPLTLAIIDGQIVRVGDQRYIIPINSIVRSFRPSAQQVSTILNRGEIASTLGELVPVMRLSELFSVPDAAEDLAHGLLVMVEEDNERCCLLVDELLGQQQVVIKSLGEMMGSVRGVSGGAIMGDGRISLILDIPGLIDLARG